jgi:hypothetical protein
MFSGGTAQESSGLFGCTAPCSRITASRHAASWRRSGRQAGVTRGTNDLCNPQLPIVATGTTSDIKLYHSLHKGRHRFKQWSIWLRRLRCPSTAMVGLARRGRAVPMVVHAVSGAVDAVHALVDRLPRGTQARPDMNRRDAVLA